MTDLNLEGCPFCGEKVEFLSGQNKFYCNNCGAEIQFRGYSQKSEIKLIDRWNKRAIINNYTDRDFIVIP